MSNSLLRCSVLFCIGWMSVSSVSIAETSAVVPALGDAVLATDNQWLSVNCIDGEHTAHTREAVKYQLQSIDLSNDLIETMTGYEVPPLHSIDAVKVSLDHRYSRYFLISAFIENRIESLNNPSVKDGCRQYIATQLVDDSEKQKRFGDSYISDSFFGAYAAGTIEVHFPTQEDHLKYAGQLYVTPTGIELMSDLLSESQTYLSGIKVTFTLFQQGGDPLQFREVMAGKTPICDLGNLLQCDAMISSIYSYTHHQFPKQLISDDDYIALFFNSQVYTGVSIGDVANVLGSSAAVDPSWQVQKIELTSFLSSTIHNLAFLERLLSEGQILSENNVNGFQTMKNNLSRDVALAQARLVFCESYAANELCKYDPSEYSQVSFSDWWASMPWLGFETAAEDLLATYEASKKVWWAAHATQPQGQRVFATQYVDQTSVHGKYGTYLGWWQRKCFASYDLRTDYLNDEGALIQTEVLEGIQFTFTLRWKWYQKSRYCTGQQAESAWSELRVFQRFSKYWQLPSL